MDIEQADALLVNSHFVKETCVRAGIEADKIHVIHLGVDDKFFEHVVTLDERQIEARQGSPLLFAGGIQRRKGVQDLATALLGLERPWKLKMVGGAEKGIEAHPDISRLFASDRVQRHGIVTRPQLAGHMQQSSIFVFPSYCEGSARVIFEAMACGCYIITTPNSGSVVEDGVHGRLVPPGDAGALRSAIESALDNPIEVAKIGARNTALVSERYRQSNYGANVMSLYKKLLDDRRRS
jgi:glycosyltransferase involved in cell wall biosynthesis